jgi:hypothetical protein
VGTTVIGARTPRARSSSRTTIEGAMTALARAAKRVLMRTAAASTSARRSGT